MQSPLSWTFLNVFSYTKLFHYFLPRDHKQTVFLLKAPLAEKCDKCISKGWTLTVNHFAKHKNDYTVNCPKFSQNEARTHLLFKKRWRTLQNLYDDEPGSRESTRLKRQTGFPLVLRNVIGAISLFFSITHRDNTSGNIYYGVISHISEIAVFLSISKLTVVCLKADPDHHFAWVFLRTTSHSYINRQFFSDFHRRTSLQMHTHMQTVPTIYLFPSEPNKLISNWTGTTLAFRVKCCVKWCLKVKIFCFLKMHVFPNRIRKSEINASKTFNKL